MLQQISCPGRRRLLAAAAALASIGAIAGCVSFTTEPSAIASRLAARGYQPEHCQAFHEDRQLGWVTLGPAQAPCAVLVHGSPGTWDAWLDVALDPRLADVRLVLPDRAGYGTSGRGHAETSIARQALLLAPAVASCGAPAVLVGHSLGGPIVARYAADHPEQVAGLVLVAPSLDPARERLLWFQKVARFRLIQALLPTDLVTAEREILPLGAELGALLARWPAVRAPTSVLQGMADTLVDPGNADFAAERLGHVALTIQRIPEQGHLIPWERPELVVDAILRHLPGPRSVHPTTAALAGWPVATNPGRSAATAANPDPQNQRGVDSPLPTASSTDTPAAAGSPTLIASTTTSPSVAASTDPAASAADAGHPATSPATGAGSCRPLPTALGGA